MRSSPIQLAIRQLLHALPGMLRAAAGQHLPDGRVRAGRDLHRATLDRAAPAGFHVCAGECTRQGAAA